MTTNTTTTTTTTTRLLDPVCKISLRQPKQLQSPLFATSWQASLWFATISRGTAAAAAAAATTTTTTTITTTTTTTTITISTTVWNMECSQN